MTVYLLGTLYRRTGSITLCASCSSIHHALGDFLLLRGLFSFAHYKNTTGSFGRTVKISQSDTNIDTINRLLPSPKTLLSHKIQYLANAETVHAELCVY